MRYANEHNDAVTELPEAILCPTRTDDTATSAENNAEAATNPETTTAVKSAKGKKILPSATHRYYSRSDACNQEFRRKCVAGIENPALGPSPADLCCALLGVQGCDERNLPKRHDWWKLAEAHPAFADYCRLAVERHKNTRGQQFVVCLSDESLRPKHSPPKFTFTHPDYDGGHPPDEMLPHMNSNHPTAERTVARRGRGRPLGSRNRPKGERAGTDGVKKATPRKRNNAYLTKVLDETSTTGSAENEVGNAERQLHIAESSSPEQASTDSPETPETPSLRESLDQKNDSSGDVENPDSSPFIAPCIEAYSNYAFQPIPITSNYSSGYLNINNNTGNLADAGSAAGTDQ